MASCSRWPTRAICSRRAICTRSSRSPRSCDIGISALKIEGRYKDADYVALTTRAYRQAVDEAWAGRADASIASELQLEQVYSRGLGSVFLTGTNHQAVVQGRAPRHRGVLMGTRDARVEHGVVIEPASQRVAPLKPGDGVVFDAADWRSPQEPEEGGRIFEVQRATASWNCASATASLNVDAHPSRRPGLAHARSRSRQAGAAVRRGRGAGAQAAGVGARDGARRRSRW